MESSSRIYTSPSFNTHSSNNIADIADRVVQELRSENHFNDDDVFIFSNDDNKPEIGDDNEVNTSFHTETVKHNEEEDIEEDDYEFEFPSCEVSAVEVVSGDQISPRYPLFDRSLLSEIKLNLCNDGVDTSKTDSKPPPSTRCSLMKLLKEDPETTSPSTSDSSSEGGNFDGITPGTYCVWKPKTEPRGKHRKSNSISIGNTSNRWKVRDLLKRSYSNDDYSGKDSPVLLFIPPMSPEKVNKMGKTGKATSAVGGGVASTKAERKIPAYKSKIGNIRLPPYLPYRQDQVAAFANSNGSNKNIYRY